MSCDAGGNFINLIVIAADGGFDGNLGYDINGRTFGKNELRMIYLLETGEEDSVDGRLFGDGDEGLFGSCESANECHHGLSGAVSMVNSSRNIHVQRRHTCMKSWVPEPAWGRPGMAMSPGLILQR